MATTTDKVAVGDDAVELVRLAIATTPPNADEWEFRTKVRDRLATLAHMTSRQSLESVRAAKLLACKYVKAELLSIELEEESNRWVVTVKGEEGSDQETETFRTERRETNLGQHHFEQLSRYIGVECLFMLFLEPMTGKRKTVRTLQHFIPHGKATGRQPAQGSRHSTQSSRPANDTPSVTKGLLDDARLKGQDKVVVAKRLREELGIGNPLKIPNEHVDAARAFIEDVIAKRGQTVTDPAEHFPGATYEGED